MCHLDVGLAGGDLGGQGALHVAEELDAGGGGAPNILVITDLQQREVCGHEQISIYQPEGGQMRGTSWPGLRG